MAEKPTKLWKAIDWPKGSRPHYLTENDACWYARSYLSGGTYKASDDNSDVLNLKIDPEHRGTPRWYYRGQAVAKFARELSELLPKTDDGVVYNLAPMPTSKPRGADGYNDRLDCVLQSLASRRDDINVIDAVRRTTAIRSASRSVGNRPNVDEHKDTLEATGEAKAAVFLVDDVITVGATFRACSDVLTEADPGLKVYGIFWAKTCWEDVNLGVDLSGVIGK